MRMEYGKASFAAKPAAVVQAAGQREQGARTRPNRPVADEAAARSIPVKKHDDWVDIAWALINSPEFLYRH